MIAVEQVSKTFSSGWFKKEGKTVLADITLHIAPGTVHSLLGLSGSGKTTLGRLIVGLDRPSSGCIRLEGITIEDWLTQRRMEFARTVQMLFQNPHAAFHPYLTIEESLREPYMLHRIGYDTGGGESEWKRQVGVWIRAGLERMELPASVLSRYPRELSGGQLQRVSLERILSLNPRYIILDEPTSMLDSVTQYKLMEQLKTIQQERDLTYVYISHDIDLVKYISHHISVIQDGHIVETGEAATVLKNPQSELLVEMVKWD